MQKWGECIGKGYLRSNIEHKILENNESNCTCGSIGSIGHQNTIKVIILGMFYFIVVKHWVILFIVCI